MARKVRNEVAVGITVLVVLALAVYIVVMLADWSSLSTAQKEITVRVHYKVGLKGLQAGSPVHLGGFKIGHVTHTGAEKLEPTTADTDDVYVFFTMKIAQQVQLRSDCVLVPQSNVLGGQTLLAIRDLGHEGAIIKDGQTVDLTLADNVMEAIQREFNPDNPESLLVRLKEDIPAITSRIQQTLKKADSTFDIAQLAMKEDIPAITRQLRQTFTKADSALDTARSALEKLNEFAGDERIDRIISNLAEVSVNLKLTSQEVRRAPWKLLYKPKRREFKIQALVDSAGAFAAGAERLDSAALRLHKLIAAAGDEPLIDKDQIKSMVSELETSFEQFQKAEQKFWEDLE